MTKKRTEEQNVIRHKTVKRKLDDFESQLDKTLDEIDFEGHMEEISKKINKRIDFIQDIIDDITK